jgi:hypothetical protein
VRQASTLKKARKAFVWCKIRNKGVKKMKVMLGIRDRMLLSALLPVALVVVGLVVALTALHLNDLQTTHHQRLRSVAHQVAVAS